MRWGQAVSSVVLRRNRHENARESGSAPEPGQRRKGGATARWLGDFRDDNCFVEGVEVGRGSTEVRPKVKFDANRYVFPVVVAHVVMTSCSMVFNIALQWKCMYSLETDTL